jgi:hypothetical protein
MKATPCSWRVKMKRIFEPAVDLQGGCAPRREWRAYIRRPPPRGMRDLSKVVDFIGSPASDSPEPLEAI